MTHYDYNGQMCQLRYRGVRSEIHTPAGQIYRLSEGVSVWIGELYLLRNVEVAAYCDAGGPAFGVGPAEPGPGDPEAFADG